jgi:hypothetical protein
MVTVICGYSAHGFASDGGHSDHCDWSMHFTGVAGSAPKPVPICRPVLAARLAPAIVRTAPRTTRRLRAHSARAPPERLLPVATA